MKSKCLWKITLENNDKGIGTSFAKDRTEYLPCDECLGYKCLYIPSRYVAEETDSLDSNKTQRENQ